MTDRFQRVSENLWHIWLSLSRIKKRLKEWAIIKQILWVWFMNPAIISKWDRIEADIFEEFKKENSKLFSITEL